MMSHPLAVGIDLGGTNLKGAVVTSDAAVLRRHAIPTNLERGPVAVVEDMEHLVDGLLKQVGAERSSLAGVGVAAPGPLSPTSGRILRTANLPGWVDVPLRDLVVERIGRPVFLENDGNAAAFGEFTAALRAGEAAEDLVMFTLGTGVGCGVILGRRILHGHFENAAELGHMIVAVDGLPCPCGQRGCLERYSSAGAVARRVAAALENGEASRLAGTGGTGRTLDAELVIEAARAGDALCKRIWDEACAYLALACINVQHAYNPARIILGGGMARAGAFLVGQVLGHVERRRWRLCDDLPAITLGRLGYDAGVVGAAALCFGDPPANPGTA